MHCELHSKQYIVKHKSQIDSLDRQPNQVDDPTWCPVEEIAGNVSERKERFSVFAPCRLRKQHSDWLLTSGGVTDSLCYTLWTNYCRKKCHPGVTIHRCNFRQLCITGIALIRHKQVREIQLQSSEEMMWNYGPAPALILNLSSASGRDLLALGNECRCIQLINCCGHVVMFAQQKTLSRIYGILKKSLNTAYSWQAVSFTG